MISLSSGLSGTESADTQIGRALQHNFRKTREGCGCFQELAGGSQGQQFTYGVVREGVIAENFPQISAKFPQTFRRISAPFPGAIERSFRELCAEFPQNFRKLSAKTPSLTTP